MTITSGLDLATVMADHTLSDPTSLGPIAVTDFDYRTFSDPAIVTEYEHLLRRARLTGDALQRHYGKGRAPIETKYVAADIFNARVSKPGNRYLIEINNSVPLFLLILFGRLLSDEAVLPGLDASGELASNYELPAIIDPMDFTRRASWKVALNEARGYAAGTLADVCGTFVLLHEFGHVVCGHLEAVEKLEGEAGISELTSHNLLPKKFYDRRQAWEADADLVAAGLMMNFFRELLAVTQTNERVAAIFGTGPGTIERILAISSVSMFAFFAYLKGTSDKLHFMSSHPHPIVRAHYMRQMIVAHARQHWDLDLALLNDEADAHLDGFLRAMREIEIFGEQQSTHEYLRTINRHYDRVERLRLRYHTAAAPWSWVEWGTP